MHFSENLQANFGDFFAVAYFWDCILITSSHFIFSYLSLSTLLQIHAFS